MFIVNERNDNDEIVHVKFQFLSVLSHLWHVVTTILLFRLRVGSSLDMLKYHKCVIFTKINYFMYECSYCIKIENY